MLHPAPPPQPEPEPALVLAARAIHASHEITNALEALTLGRAEEQALAASTLRGPHRAAGQFQLHDLDTGVMAGVEPEPGVQADTLNSEAEPQPSRVVRMESTASEPCMDLDAVADEAAAIGAEQGAALAETHREPVADTDSSKPAASAGRAPEPVPALRTGSEDAARSSGRSIQRPSWIQPQAEAVAAAPLPAAITPSPAAPELPPPSPAKPEAESNSKGVVRSGSVRLPALDTTKMQTYATDRERQLAEANEAETQARLSSVSFNFSWG